SDVCSSDLFLENGCRKVCFLVIDKNVSIGQTRLAGYIDAHKACGVKLDKELVIDCSNDLEQSYGSIKHALKVYRPDALVSSVERLATTTYQVCIDENIRIPEDVKIISYTNIQVAALLNPALSTIEQPAEEVGERAAELLFHVLKQKTLKEKRAILSAKIIHRASSRKC